LLRLIDLVDDKNLKKKIETTYNLGGLKWKTKKSVRR
jgi:hypothetical protein